MNIKNIPKVPGSRVLSALLKVGVIGGFGVYGVANSINNLEGGHRAIVFNWITGIKERVYPEGTHFKIPWFERPIIYDVRAQPYEVESHTALQSFVSCGPQTNPALLLDTITRKYRENGINTDNGDTVEWMILSGNSRCPENEHLLSRTATIFKECFGPTVADMLYGRNISGEEFGGMYCLVLMVNSVVVSAALLRIFDQKVAELPIVATSLEYQGMGYFQGLFVCIENLLSSLNVENLLLPATEEAESMWTKKFGFTKMTEQELQKYQREVKLTTFEGTSMLEKKVPRFSEST